MYRKITAGHLIQKKINVNDDMVIVDGHNRFRICEKHGLPFKMLMFSFTDLLEAKQWALDTQKGLSAPVIKCKKTPRKKCSFVAEEAKKR